MKTSYLHSIESSLKDSLTLLLDKSTLYKGAYSALFPGGKRIRPYLAALIFEELSDQTIPWQVFNALEYVHTYSLVQDDLPCMDNDDYRRGKPSLHQEFDEAYALLVSDFFLTGAFDLIAQSDLDPLIQSKLIRILAYAAGGHQLLEGQLLDLRGNLAYEVINQKKTAALFEAAFLFGGVCAQASEEKLAWLKQLAREFGLFFQAQDDWIDQDHLQDNDLQKHYESCMTQAEGLSEIQQIVTAMYEQACLNKVP